MKSDFLSQLGGPVASPTNDPKIPEGFPNARFPLYMPCVEHCMSSIVDKWCRAYDETTTGILVDRLCHKVGTHPRLKHFSITDNRIIHQWADEIEIEVLKEKTLNG